MNTEALSDNKLHELYCEWWSNRTSEEYNLHSIILEYENTYFADMTFQEDSLCWEIASFIDEEFDHLYLELSPAMYRCYIVDNKKPYWGQCNGMERTISITQSHVSDKSVILHEMIHAYEFILSQHEPILQEYLLLALYKKLLPSIPDLDKRLVEHSEIYGQHCVSSIGGNHGLLFYLKSLDLDIRCGYSLGTVCGYGRDSGKMFY